MEDGQARPQQKQASGGSGDRFVTCGQGHEHWGAHGAAGLLIRHRDGDSGAYHYLLQKRSENVDHGGTWSTPGGAIGKDETPEQGAQREAREEWGSIPKGLTHHHTFTDDHGAGKNVSSRCPRHGAPENREDGAACECPSSGKGWAYHTVVMDAPERFAPGGKGETGWESDGHAWVTPQEAKDLPLHPGFAASFDKVRRSGAKTAAATVMYHGTSPAHRNSIGQHGLSLLHSQDEGDWKSIYMTERPGDDPHEDVWRVDVGGYHPEVDGDSGEDRSVRGESYFVNHDIPPERLKLHRPGTGNKWIGYPPKMAAATEPAAQVYYHGSAHRFKAGDMIEPGHKAHDMSSPDHVYLAASESIARTFGGLAAVRNKAKTYSIYHVEPTGPVEPDPDGPGYRSKHPLRVIKVHERGSSPEDPNPWWNQPGTGRGYERQAATEPASDLEAELQLPSRLGGFERNPGGYAPDPYPSSGKDRVYLRFGDWHPDERSVNHAQGWREEGVSAYHLDKEGHPVDPDPKLERDPEEYGNDPAEEMGWRVQRAERVRARGEHSHTDVAHLVKGEHAGMGYDGEPLLQNVRRVGDWMDHRHLFIPGAPRHRLARDEGDEDYEPPEEQPLHHEGALKPRATDAVSCPLCVSGEYPRLPLSRIKNLYTVDWDQSDDEDVRVRHVLQRKYQKADPALERSMRERGQTRPIELRRDPFTNKANTLGQGHHRVSIADRLGWDHLHYVRDDESATRDPEYDEAQRLAKQALKPRATMISLDVPEGLIHKVDNGVDEDPHITVVYAGHGVSDDKLKEITERAREAAANTPALSGHLEGLGTFEPSESSDGKVPAWVPVHVPGLDLLHEQLADLSASEHPFYSPARDPEVLRAG